MDIKKLLEEYICFYDNAEKCRREYWVNGTLVASWGYELYEDFSSCLQVREFFPCFNIAPMYYENVVVCGYASAMEKRELVFYGFKPKDIKKHFYWNSAFLDMFFVKNGVGEILYYKRGDELIAVSSFSEEEIRQLKHMCEIFTGEDLNYGKFRLPSYMTIPDVERKDIEYCIFEK